jgi:hypothetical protein
MDFSEGNQPFTGNSMAITSIHRRWFSYRGLSPHKFMPMPGVHKAKQHRALRALDLATLGRCWKRYAA